MKRQRFLFAVLFGVAAMSAGIFSAAAQIPCEENFVEVFNKGNTFYKENKYDEALRAYETVLQNGRESGALYYNLGNAYFKKGELAKALLSYERAKFLIPGDSDLASNEAHCRSLLNVSEEAEAGPLFLRWLDRIAERFTLNGLAVLFLIFNIAVFSVLALRLYGGLPRYHARPALAVFFVVLVLSLTAFARKAVVYGRSALVMNQEAEVKFEPLASATTYFRLGQGHRVEVLDKEKNWYKLKRKDGKIGWVEDQELGFFCIR